MNPSIGDISRFIREHQHLTTYGPTYDRNIREDLDRACHSIRIGERDSALYWFGSAIYAVEEGHAPLAKIPAEELRIRTITWMRAHPAEQEEA